MISTMEKFLILPGIFSYFLGNIFLILRVFDLNWPKLKNQFFKELDDVKLDRIKEELTQQIEGPYKDIVRQLEQELQKLQEDLNKLKYESKFLKSNKDREKTEHNNFIDQLKLKHEVELSTIRKDRDVLREKVQENNHTEINRIKEVIRENNQLRIKVKSLIEENDEIREKIEHIEAHNSSLVRNHSKALSDYTTKVSVLEVIHYLSWVSFHNLIKLLY